AGTDGVLVVLGLDDGQRDVGSVEEDVVGAQHRALVAAGAVPAHHHAAGAQRVFAVNLLDVVPSGLRERGRDELVANVGFGKLLLVQAAPWNRRAGGSGRLLQEFGADYQRRT